MLKALIFAVLVSVGLLPFIFFYSSTLELPKLGTVEKTPLSEVSGKDFSTQGKPSLVTFFYTRCPDVCPFTMQDLKKLQKMLKEKGVAGDQYSIVAVTLDPEYDTKERIMQYKKAFDISDENWLFLRGSEKDTKKFARSFRMIYEKSEEGYVTHSTTMYMVDSKSQIRARYDMSTGQKKLDIEQVAEHLIQLTK